MNQLRSFPDRFGSRFTHASDRIEVVGCSYHDSTTDFDDTDTDAAQFAREKYAFLLKFSSPIHEEYGAEVPLGIAMLVLSVSFLLTLVLGIMHGSQSPQVKGNMDRRPSTPTVLGQPSTSAARTVSSIAGNFKIIVTPVSSTMDLPSPGSPPRTIATISVHQTDGHNT